MSKFKIVLASGGLGLVSGVILERLRGREVATHRTDAIRLPGLPRSAMLSAATALTTTSSSGRSLAEIPPEPEKGLGRTSEIMRFGFPGLDNIRSRKDYVISYDAKNKVPHWVFEHLTRESVRRNEKVDRTKSDFKEDSSIHTYFRATNSDFKYSGFDRGHMAAAANHRQNQDLVDETFLLSNMAPQVGAGFNRDKWEHLERHVRSLTKLFKNVYVCTGPLYLAKREVDGKMYIRYQVIGDNQVSVPTHFFKVVVGETDNGQLELESYVLPNEVIPDNVALATFFTPIDAVERAAGLLFFDKIARNRLTRINGKVVK